MGSGRGREVAFNRRGAFLPGNGVDPTRITHARPPGSREDREDEDEDENEGGEKREPPASSPRRAVVHAGHAPDVQCNNPPGGTRTVPESTWGRTNGRGGDGVFEGVTCGGVSGSEKADVCCTGAEVLIDVFDPVMLSILPRLSSKKEILEASRAGMDTVLVLVRTVRAGTRMRAKIFHSSC